MRRRLITRFGSDGRILCFKELKAGSVCFCSRWLSSQEVLMSIFKPLRMTGFPTRKAARKALFKQVRVSHPPLVTLTKAEMLTKFKILYDSDFEQDRVCLIQSLLLMSLWYETLDDPKNAWHWLGLAYSLSLTIGLDRNNAFQNENLEVQKLRRRIWWSLYTRDAIVSLGLKKPLRVSSADGDIPLLTLDDFEGRDLQPKTPLPFHSRATIRGEPTETASFGRRSVH